MMTAGMNRFPCNIYFAFDWTTNSNRSNQNHLCRNLVYFRNEKDQVRTKSNEEKIRLDSVKRKREEEAKDSPEKKVECTNASRSPPEREGSKIPCPPRPLLLLFDFLLLPRKDKDFFWMEGRDDGATLVSSGISQTSIFASRCFLFSDESPSGLMVADVWMQQASW